MNEDIPLPVDLPAAALKSARRRVSRLQTVNDRFESARIQGRANGEGPQTTHKRPLMKLEPVPPMTLGNAARAGVRLIVWCRACGHRVEPDAADMAERYGADTSVPEWRERLVCSRRGSRNVDMVVTGIERR
jgi:hypothetical protein